MFSLKAKKLLLAGLTIVMMASFGFFPATSKAITISPLIYEFEGRPGDKLIGLMKVSNENDSQRTYYSTVEDFTAGGEGGEPAFVKKDETGFGLASWITVQEKIVNLMPKEKISVIFEINVPTNADPGGHYAAVFWSTQPPSVGGTAVGAVAMTGSLVLLRVAGEAKEDIRVSDFRTKDEKSFYTHLPITIFSRLENKGNVHIKPRGAIVIKNMLGRQSKILTFNPYGGNVLPQSARRFENVWQKNPENLAESEWKKEWNNFGLGRYTAIMSVQYGVGNEKVLISAFHFWVISWQVTLFWVVIIVLAFLILRFAIKRYNRWILRQAGRRR